MTCPAEQRCATSSTPWRSPPSRPSWRADMSEFVLVVNAGSSSLKYSLVEAGSGTSTASGLIDRIGEATGQLTHEAPSRKSHAEREVASHEDALQAAIDALPEHGPAIED